MPDIPELKKKNSYKDYKTSEHTKQGTIQVRFYWLVTLRFMDT